MQESKPRLVIVSGSYPAISCGVAGHTALIAAAAAKVGQYDVAVLTSGDAAVQIKDDLAYQVFPRIKAWGLWDAKAICREILALSPDVVHIQVPTVRYAGWRSAVMSRVGPMLKRLSPKVRLVVMQHDIAVSRPLFRRRYAPLLRAADAVTVSNSRDEQAVLAMRVERGKIYRTPVSSHFPMIRSSQANRESLREQFGIAPKSLVVSYFGYVHPGRNVDVIVEAIGRLRKIGHDVFGVIVGGAPRGSEGYYQHCRGLAAKWAVEDRLVWTGYAANDKVAHALAASDVFVSLPDRGADLRNTSIIAAMLAELPVITTQNPRYYIDEDLKRLGCFYVPMRDAEGLAKTILQAVFNPPPLDFRRRVADYLDPQKVWPIHVEINHLAYQGLPSPPTTRFEL